MPGEQVEDVITVLLPAARFDLVSQHHFLAIVVHARLEVETTALPRVGNRPPGERACDLLYVLLCVAAVHAQRVQLHQLARVILVEAAPAVLSRAGRKIGQSALAERIRLTPAHPWI